METTREFEKVLEINKFIESASEERLNTKLQEMNLEFGQDPKTGKIQVYGQKDSAKSHVTWNKTQAPKKTTEFVPLTPYEAPINFVKSTTLNIKAKLVPPRNIKTKITHLIYTESNAMTLAPWVE